MYNVRISAELIEQVCTEGAEFNGLRLIEGIPSDHVLCHVEWDAKSREVVLLFGRTPEDMKLVFTKTNFDAP